MLLTIVSFLGAIHCLVVESGCLLFLLLGEGVEDFGLTVSLSAVNNCQQGIKGQ